MTGCWRDMCLPAIDKSLGSSGQGTSNFRHAARESTTLVMFPCLHKNLGAVLLISRSCNGERKP